MRNGARGEARCERVWIGAAISVRSGYVTRAPVRSPTLTVISVPTIPSVLGAVCISWSAGSRISPSWTGISRQHVGRTFWEPVCGVHAPKTPNRSARRNRSKAGHRRRCEHDRNVRGFSAVHLAALSSSLFCPATPQVRFAKAIYNGRCRFIRGEQQPQPSTRPHASGCQAFRSRPSPLHECSSHQRSEHTRHADAPPGALPEEDARGAADGP